VAEAGLIGVLRRLLVEGVVRGGPGKVRGCAVVTAFGAGAAVACLPTPAPIGVVNGSRVASTD